MSIKVLTVDILTGVIIFCMFVVPLLFGLELIELNINHEKLIKWFILLIIGSISSLVLLFNLREHFISKEEKKIKMD